MKRIILFLLSFNLFFLLFSNDATYSIFRNGALYGFIDENLNIIIPAKYEFIICYDTGYYCHKKDLDELLDSSLNIVHSSNRLNMRYCHNSEFFFNENLKDFVLNIDNNTLREYKRSNQYYSMIYFYNHNKGLVIEKNISPLSYSVGDANGKIISNNIEQAARWYSEGLMAVIYKDGRSGFINENGELVIETDFYINANDLLSPRKEPVLSYFFKEGVAVVRQGEKNWKLYNTKGNHTEFPKNYYPSSNGFKNGLLLVSMNESEERSCGYMNKQLELVIPCIFDKAEDFYNGFACVVYQGKDAILDTEGNLNIVDDLLEGKKNVYKNVLEMNK